MKKLLLLLLPLALIEISHAQVLKRKINSSTPAANSNIKTMNSQQSTPPQNANEKKMVISAPVKKIQFISLDPKSPGHQNLKAKLNTALPAGWVLKFPPSKLYTYQDGSKTRVTVSTNSNGAAPWPDDLKKPVVKSTSNDNQDSCSCIIQNVTLSANSSDFLNNNFANTATYLLPGAIYYYDDLINGKFKELTDARYPIILTTDNPNIEGDSYVVVEHPDAVNLQDAVTKLRQRFTKDIYQVGTGSFPYKVYEYSNSSDMSMKIGADATGYGFSASGSYSKSTSSHDEKLTVDAYKELFTIYAAIPADSAFKGYFKTYPDNTHFPVIISSVHYGERVLANMDVKFNQQSDAVNFNASYDGFIWKAKVGLDYFSGNSSVGTSINAYYVGGPSKYTTLSFNKKDLENQLKDFFSNVTYQTTQPIIYELQDLNGNPVNVVSATDNFSVPLCAYNTNASLAVADLSTPLTPKIPASVSFARVKTGNNSGDDKDPDTHWSFGVFDSNENSVASFHDDSNNDPYSDGTTTKSLYLVQEKRAIFGDFVANKKISGVDASGRIHINIAPNGHDTWNIDQFTINLNFVFPDGLTVKSQQLTWPGIRMSESNRNVDLLFKYDPDSNTLQPVQSF